MVMVFKREILDVFNVASGREVSINELANIVLRIAGLNVKPIYEAGRPGDIRRSVADISKIVRVLGFKPKVGMVDVFTIFIYLLYATVR